jgi:tetratricopeptide (TPR) repeat protein
MVNSPDDWVMTELRLLHAAYHWPFYRDIPGFLEPLEKARNLVESNPDLRCFESLIYTFEAWAKSRESDSGGSLIDSHRGQQLAERYDDSLYMYMSLLNLAATFRTINIQESIAKFEELYDLVQELEVPYLVCEVLNDSALAFEAAGEYDPAISSHNETIKTCGFGDTSFLILPRIYATLGNSLPALEWAIRGFEYAGHLEYPVLYLRKAWALALSNRIDDAQSNLDTAHALIMKTDMEMWLSDYYHISGVVEFKRENF